MDSAQVIEARKAAKRDEPRTPTHHDQPLSDHDEGVIPKDLPRPHTLTVIAMAALLLVLLAGLFVVGWLPHHRAEEQAKGDAAEVANAIPVVTVAPPQQSAETTDLVQPCDVKANQETAIYSRTNGYLKRRLVDIQDHVKQGDLLAEIDTPEVDAQLLQAKGALTQAEAGVIKAQADLKLAHSTLERYHSTQNSVPGTVTRQEMEEKENAESQAQGALDQAKANVVAADAAVKRLAVLQGFEKVTAPFSGTITARNYDVGALVSSDAGPGREMFRLADTDPMRVFVRVPQVYAGQIKIGSRAFLTANDRDFEGKVIRSSESVDPNTLTMLFEISVPNKEGELYPGMYGSAKLSLTQARPTLLIPTSALRFDAGGIRVVVVRDGKVHLQPVKPGRDLGTQLEIVDGLTPDSQVVTNPGERLEEGSAVKVVEAAKKPAAAKQAPVAAAPE